MDATDRISEEFSRLIALGYEKVHERPYAERVVFLVVVARCEKDMNGFDSIFEQALTAADLEMLIHGLKHLGEEGLAAQFSRGLKALKQDGFYEHRNWNRVSERVKRQIKTVGKRVGDQLWGLDEKLATLLDAPPAPRPAG